MALFVGQERQKQKLRASNSSRSRGRGGRSARGRGGRGRAHQAHYGSRTLDQITPPPEDETAAAERHDEQSEGEEDMDSASEAEADDMHVGSAYQTLLQSFANDIDEIEERSRKKRKLEDFAPISQTFFPHREVVDTDADVETSTGFDTIMETKDDFSDADSDIDSGSDGNLERSEMSETDRDPFCTHFDLREPETLTQSITATKNGDWSTATCTELGNYRIHFTKPRAADSSDTGTVTLPQDATTMKLKQKLRRQGLALLDGLDPLSKRLMSSTFNYQDVLFTVRTIENSDTFRTITNLHALNHIFKTRDTVIKHNATLAKEDPDADREFRDQGFTRPKVLIITPTRQSCAEQVENLLALWEPEQQENRKRFLDSFASTEDSIAPDKPDDFRELFKGNNDDMFKVGIKFTRKTLKFYSQFYASDIIIASPLGLRMAIRPDDPKKKDCDFLSSIELVIVNQADALLMQNWDHLELIFDHLNLHPKEAHGCDFGRVRNWYLDGNARFVRQTIVSSSFISPQLKKLQSKHMVNFAGRTRFSQLEEGVMNSLKVSSRLTFQRIPCLSPVAEPEERFKHFTQVIVPSLAKAALHGSQMKGGTLVFLPTYADFVRVRNFLSTATAAHSISFGSVSEYTSAKEIARGRSHFMSGRHSVLLYTERAHHFRRYLIKGAHRIVMYGLPDNPVFFREIVEGSFASSMKTGELKSGNAQVNVLFSKLDAFKLERIVGSSRFRTMLNGQGGDVFEFS